jgi:hypothetical protein
MNKSDEDDLRNMHTIEDEDEGVPRPTLGVSTNFDANNLDDEAMFFLGQIKELQEELEDKMKAVQRVEMAILGYSHALQERLQDKKGH